MSFTVRTLNNKSGGGARKWAGRAAAALTVAQPLIGLLRTWNQYRLRKKKREHRIGALKRTLTILVAILAALLLLGGVAKAIVSVSGIGISNVLSVTGADLPTDENGFTNFLLLGQGDKDHDGKDLTDTIMIASVDPASQSVAMLSLPRDLYFLSTKAMGKGKINAMYRDMKSYLMHQEGLEKKEAGTEALRQLADEIGRKLSLNIHHAIKVDFAAFTKAVDTVGGVEITVPYDIEDALYPDENFGYDPFIIKAGVRHLDGNTALRYARSRHTTSDFGRSARQQQLLTALAGKAKEKGVLTDAAAITSFMNIMKEHVETTMTIRELIGVAGLTRSIEKTNVITMQLNDRNALYDYIIEPGGMLYTPPRDMFGGASVLLPVSIPEYPVTWKQPQALVQLLFTHRDIYLNNPAISILNAGAPPGSAGKLSTELIRFGFNVTKTENSDTENRDTSMMTAMPEQDSATTFFASLLGLPLLPAPDDLPDTQREHITIILGADYAYAPIQNLLPQLQSLPQPQP